MKKIKAKARKQGRQSEMKKITFKHFLTSSMVSPGELDVLIIIIFIVD